MLSERRTLAHKGGQLCAVIGWLGKLYISGFPCLCSATSGAIGSPGSSVTSADPGRATLPDFPHLSFPFSPQQSSALFRRLRAPKQHQKTKSKRRKQQQPIHCSLRRSSLAFSSESGTYCYSPGIKLGDCALLCSTRQILIIFR